MSAARSEHAASPATRGKAILTRVRFYAHDALIVLSLVAALVVTAVVSR